MSAPALRQPNSPLRLSVRARALVRRKLIDFDAVLQDGSECIPACTVRYASPEVARARKLNTKLVASPAVDTWACGLILHEVFAWQPLLDDDTTLECATGPTPARVPGPRCASASRPLCAPRALEQAPGRVLPAPQLCRRSFGPGGDQAPKRRQADRPPASAAAGDAAAGARGALHRPRRDQQGLLQDERGHGGGKARRGDSQPPPAGPVSRRAAHHPHGPGAAGRCWRSSRRRQSRRS